jgi:hypothetical protein
MQRIEDRCTLTTPAAGRPRPTAVPFTRSLAYWNASRERSEMNFCAERDKRRFLRRVSDTTHPLDLSFRFRFKKRKDSSVVGEAGTRGDTHNRGSEQSKPALWR